MHIRPEEEKDWREAAGYLADESAGDAFHAGFPPKEKKRLPEQPV